jgi:hypothetical protein
MKAYKKALVLFLLLLVLSAGTAFAAAEGSEGGGSWSPWMLLWRVINTAALIGVLIYFLKKPSDPKRLGRRQGTARPGRAHNRRV